MKEKVLFITNRIYVDADVKEGGVKLCTLDFINLLEEAFNVILFKVEFNRSIAFRLRFKLGIDCYEEYNPDNYLNSLIKTIKENDITKVFINLSNASAFSELTKNKISRDVKVILCSHGNESGDFLHRAARNPKELTFFKRVFSSNRLGNVMKQEVRFRLNSIDMVLTVSEIEDALEKWLGARSTFMVPRTFKKDFIEWNPIGKRVGFIGDMSHFPNLFGLQCLCEAYKKMDSNIEIRVVGRYDASLEQLSVTYPFIKCLGYLDEASLLKEASTWNYFLNLVFYYSKGVSTKLERGLSWGLPVLSTFAGNRGYIFKNGLIPTYSTPKEFAEALHRKLNDNSEMQADKKQTVSIVNDAVTNADIMRELLPLIKTL